MVAALSDTKEKEQKTYQLGDIKAEKIEMLWWHEAATAHMLSTKLLYFPQIEWVGDGRGK